MPADFLDAARRHFSDGSYLRDAKRLPNADHLLGLATECALKAMLVALGAQVDTQGSPTDAQLRVHVDKLWSEFHVFASGRRGGWATARIPEDSPFDNWRVEQRYDDSASFRSAAVEDHYKAARTVMTTLERASERGDIV